MNPQDPLANARIEIMSAGKNSLYINEMEMTT
jgi:hypothetical protein